MIIVAAQKAVAVTIHADRVKNVITAEQTIGLNRYMMSVLPIEQSQPIAGLPLADDSAGPALSDRIHTPFFILRSSLNR